MLQAEDYARVLLKVEVVKPLALILLEATNADAPLVISLSEEPFAKVISLLRNTNTFIATTDFPSLVPYISGTFLSQYPTSPNLALSNLSLNSS